MGRLEKKGATDLPRHSQKLLKVCTPSGRWRNNAVELPRGGHHMSKVKVFKIATVLSSLAAIVAASGAGEKWG
jgi:hypothetical protein